MKCEDKNFFYNRKILYILRERRENYCRITGPGMEGEVDTIQVFVAGRQVGNSNPK